MKTLTPTTPKAARRAEPITTTWEIQTYDVWGNKNDGYEVNDVYRRGEVELSIPCTLNNAGTPMEFVSAYPTNAQLADVFGYDVRTRVELDGDDCNIEVRRERDGYPIGGLRCVSHESLSPIRLVGGCVHNTPHPSSCACQLCRATRTLQAINS